jgi:hypothetical protein
VPGEVLLLDLLDARLAVGRFPVQGHHIDAERLAGVDHVLGVGPQRRAGALPGVAAVEQQRAGRLAFMRLTSVEVGEAADLAVGLGGLFEIR